MRFVSSIEQRELEVWGNAKCVSTKYDDPDFSDKVEKKSEALQFLHHVTICDCSKNLLLIGNRNGTMMKGVWM